MSSKRLDRYIIEYVARHNIRESDTLEQMDNLDRCMVGKWLNYDDLRFGRAIAKSQTMHSIYTSFPDWKLSAIHDLVVWSSSVPQEEAPDHLTVTGARVC